MTNSARGERHSSNFGGGGSDDNGDCSDEAMMRSGGNAETSDTGGAADGRPAGRSRSKSVAGSRHRTHATEDGDDVSQDLGVGTGKGRHGRAHRDGVHDGEQDNDADSEPGRQRRHRRRASVHGDESFKKDRPDGRGENDSGKRRDKELADSTQRRNRRKSKFKAGSGDSKRPKSPPWDIRNSVWAPRAPWSDSKAFLDAQEVECRRMSNDWWRACAMGVDDLVAKKDDDGRADLDGNGIADELEELEALLWEMRHLIFIIFMYYTCIGNDISFLYLNQWSQLVDELQIANNKSKFLKKSDTDRLFIAVDTQAAMKQQAIMAKANPLMTKAQIAMADHDDLKKKVLSRVEFVVALVHIAILKYVVTKKIPDVSEALHRLLEGDIKPLLSSKILEHPNVFRERCCYRRDVDASFKAYEGSLRNIFTAVCITGGRGEKERHLSLDEWKGLLRGVQLIDVDCSERDVSMCFAWSRMCVVDETSVPGRMRDSHLPFEGFLEAIVRLSTLKALPTDEEIEAYECTDAAAYFIKLRSEEEDRYQQILNSRGNEWGATPQQPIARCVSHVCAMIVRRVEEDSGGASATVDMEVTFQEANSWCKKQAFGAPKR